MIGLKLRGVSFSYSNGRILDDVNLIIQPGEMVALLGPNGSGKTTLIKLASGILKPAQGEIWLDGSRLDNLSRRAVARKLAIVPQHFNLSFAFTAEEVVALGRIPFLGTLSTEKEVDHTAVNESFELAGISHLRRRRFDELSGGERQKVVLAMALAQQPELLLLDEPTLHLDIAQQVEILELVRRLNRERKVTVLAAVHDLNLAALYFDRIVMLHRGALAADGTPAAVLTQDRIKEVFSASVQVQTHPLTGTPQIIVLPQNTQRENPS
jgi:iron complex transport system ATP-binding protein